MLSVYRVSGGCRKNGGRMFRKADGLPEAGVLWTGQGPNDEAGRPQIESPARRKRHVEQAVLTFVCKRLRPGFGKPSGGKSG